MPRVIAKGPSKPLRSPRKPSTLPLGCRRNAALMIKLLLLLPSFGFLLLTSYHLHTKFSRTRTSWGDYKRASQRAFLRQHFSSDQKTWDDESSYESYDVFENQTDYRKCSINQPFPRPRHACVVDSTTNIPYCHFESLRIDVSKIISPSGGEDLKTVMGRAEEDEYPRYKPGAFSLRTPLDIDEPLFSDNLHYIRNVLDAMVVDESAQCVETHSELTLLITRYEYVNLYHTITDLWNAFLALPEATPRSVNVVFLDAHAKGSLDPVWEHLFGNVTFVKALPKGGVCYSNAVLVPPGYSSILFKREDAVEKVRCLSMMESFCNFVLGAYDLSDVKMEKGRIVIVDRVPYISHPRSDPAMAERILSNLQDVKTQLETEPYVTSVELVRLERMGFGEQIRTIRRAQIFIGNHGAAISHMLFMDKDSHVLEIMDDVGSYLFWEFSMWKPEVKYHLLPALYDRKAIPERYIKSVIEPEVQLILDPENRTLLAGESGGVGRWPGTYDEWPGRYEYDGQVSNELGDDAYRYEGSFESYENQTDYRKCSVNQPFPRPRHTCTVKSDTEIPYCHLENLRIDVSKIDSPSGGEELTTVMGRAEEDEFPKYSLGAFSLRTPLTTDGPLYPENIHYIHDVLNAIVVNESAPCVETRSKLTLFITRYEYVSLYHTINDLWNAFLALPEATPRSVNVVFLDAHAKGSLDPVWEHLFGNVTFVKALPKGGVCYSNAVLVPPGYSSILFTDDISVERLRCLSMMESFSDFVLGAYGLSDVKMEKGRVVIVEQVPYISHPRSDLSKSEGMISNFEELKSRLSAEPGVTSVEIVRLEQMHFGEQIRTLRRAQIFIGNHGDAISHMLFMDSDSHVLEFIDESGSGALSKWKTAVHYHQLQSLFDMTTLSEDYIESTIMPEVQQILTW